MNVPRNVVAIGIDHGRLVAVLASIGERVKVKKWHTATVPADIDAKDAVAFGRWLGAELDRTGLGKGKLLISVPRGEVVLKRLRLPRAEESELAGMVQLQMTRQLTMASEGAAIDFVAINNAEAVAGTTTESVSVLAAAIPGERINWYRAVAKAAGCKIERLGLQASGVCALLADVSQRHTGPILGVSVGFGSVEFAVVEHGQLVFVRAADIGLGGEGGEAALVERVSVEVKRTWMSYRVGEGSAEIEAVVIPGEGELAEDIGRRCGEALEMPWKLAPMPPALELADRMRPADHLVAAPLLGLLSESVMGRPSLDFAHPRKAPDLAAARRQRVLAASLGLIVLGGAVYMAGSISLGSLRERVAAEKKRSEKLQAQYAEYLKEDAKLNHMRQWTSAEIDWLGHIRWLSDAMPDPRLAQLDQLGGRMGAEVVFTPKSGGYDPKGWQLRHGAGFTLEGKTKGREVANQLRARLVDSEIYKLETRGADVPDKFGFELTSTRVKPEEEPPKSRVATKPSAKSREIAESQKTEEAQR